MDLQDMMGALNGPGGMKAVMLEDAFEYDEESGHTFSQAELIADVINILRLDTKAIAEAHDVEVEIQKMTPDYAAEVLQGVAQGGDLGLIEIFDEIEEQRMEILAEVEGVDTVREHQERKQALLHSVPDSAPITAVPDEEVDDED